MRGLKKLFSAFIAIILSVVSFAQGADVGMADTMRSNGRIYVVVAVMLTILTGLIIYIVRIDRKISRWEKTEGKN
jgi:hypothetical protein